MKQIITGPMGRVAYFDETTSNCGQYPALNLPDCGFSRGEALVAANDMIPTNVVKFPRKMRSRAALAMFGPPAKREN
ncbi:MAG: hypothetical protein ABJJ53_14195 [Sulfitobacter sp.]